ncbi:hypothetical protein PG997_010490 [Apiospora hydei]|uniref:Heterokaryon incompatibility domain-containing protein n=1 Tax=Apiospora hydei TaxID=1337664 RepID=A0ABR1VX61_9PEZI
MASKELSTPSHVGQGFRYDPLETPRSFRLLSLQASKQQDGPLELFMSTHTLADGQFPEYTALSYVWGGTDRTASVVLNDYQFTITPALMDALLHIRKVPQCQANYWWIDILCINQADNKERGHQVGMMRDIYQSARRVVAWLGPEASNSRHIMRALVQDPTYHGPWRGDELAFLTPLLDACLGCAGALRRKGDGPIVRGGNSTMEIFPAILLPATVDRSCFQPPIYRKGDRDPFCPQLPYNGAVQFGDFTREARNQRRKSRVTADLLLATSRLGPA